MRCKQCLYHSLLFFQIGREVAPTPATVTRPPYTPAPRTTAPPTRGQCVDRFAPIISAKTRNGRHFTFPFSGMCSYCIGTAIVLSV